MRRIVTGLLAAAVLAAAPQASANVIPISAYDISIAYKPMFGWNSTYNGTVTPITNYLSRYTGGTVGTLNDGLLPDDGSNNQLICVGSFSSCDDTLSSDPVSPEITLYLSQVSRIASIDLLAGNISNNYAPGNIRSLVVTIGGVSETVTLDHYGPINPSQGVGIYMTALLPLSLNEISASSIILSGFQTFQTPVFNIDEVTVKGSAAGAVPEPATWAMMIAGFGFAGAAMRRRKAIPSMNFA